MRDLIFALRWPLIALGVSLAITLGLYLEMELNLVLHADTARRAVGLAPLSNDGKAGLGWVILFILAATASAAIAFSVAVLVVLDRSARKKPGSPPSRG